MAASSSPSTAFDLPRNFSCERDPETGQIYYLDHTNETISWSHPRDNLPPNFECRLQLGTGKKYYADHINKATSFSHPYHKELHLPGEPDLPYPHEQCLDSEGRHFYRYHETQTSSWVHPFKLAELKTSGILDAETDTYGGEDGQAWKAWILEDIAECGPNCGSSYFVNYRTRDIDWQSPEHKRIARKKAEERRAARVAANDLDPPNC